MNYQEIKNKIRVSANDFYLVEDLFALADLLLLENNIAKILEQHDFPVEQYKEWKNKNNQKYLSTTLKIPQQ